MSDQLSLFTVEQTERTSDDYYTPKWIFDAIGLTFDLDVACPPQGPPHTPCRAYYTQKDDGLAQPWHGLIWMNPPFSKATPWVNKFLEHGNGICLTPFAKSYWFEKLWKTADTMVLPPIHMKFVGGGIFMPVVLSSIGEPATTALLNSGLGHPR